MNDFWHHIEEELIPTGLSLTDAVRLIRNMDEIRRSLFPRTKMKVLREAETYRVGLLALRRERRTLVYREAVEAYLNSKPELRPRTLAEKRQIFKRIRTALPELSGKKLSAFNAADCRQLVEVPFPTCNSRNKAIRYNKGLFRYGMQRGWCSNNHFKHMKQEKLQEQTIAVLTIPQTEALLDALRLPENRRCAAAVWLMLWAGVRPYEVARLHWSDIDLEERLIYIEPRHSKTGGARQITIHPVLYRHLKHWCGEPGMPHAPQDSLTPPNWKRKWKRLRQAARLTPWQEDTLRHTYASYHLKHFRNPSVLQWEMGHRSADMLRTRYLNMRGITAAAAACFWSMRVQPCLTRRNTAAKKVQQA